MHINTNIRFRNNLINGDEDEIFRIVSSTGFFNDEEIAVAVDLARETLVNGKESGYDFIFAEVGSEIVAYSCFGKIPCTRNSYDLYWIAVHEAFRNQGIGYALLEETEKILKEAGARRIFIETSSKPQYEPTRKFYIRSHYIEEALLRDFYDLDDDKIIYSKYLS